jgi:hypothetical protein
MKYRNLIYCKHHEGDARAFLYELPLEKDVKTGEKLCVRDRRGEHIVTAYCENWLCSDKLTEILCVANGGYFPPAKVIGTVQTVTIRQEIPAYFTVEEEMPF